MRDVQTIADDSALGLARTNLTETARFLPTEEAAYMAAREAFVAAAQAFQRRCDRFDQRLAELREAEAESGVPSSDVADRPDGPVPVTEAEISPNA